MKATTKFASSTGSASGPAVADALSLHAPPGAASERSGAAHQGDSHLHADNDSHAEGPLSRAGLLRVIQREKRRTDRSHSALSLALLEVDSAHPEARDLILEKLTAVVRETDYTAVVDADSLAILLPDTGEVGLRIFMDKIALARHARVLSVAGATYPDAAFDHLVVGRLSTPRARQAAHEEIGPQRSAQGYRLKRALDILGSGIALTLLLPFMLMVGLAIKLTSPGPALFRQQRIGQGGIPFTFYKFRSMRVNNDDRAHRDFVTGLINGKSADTTAAAAGFKMEGDPRVTPIGRFIRMTSIDELPQFYNVLRGDMSLVGPRPPVSYEAERYKGWHRRRVLEMKPGLTGIWQVEGRSRVSFDEMVRMDLKYARCCSLVFDLTILLRTVGAVLTCRGAR